MKLADLLAPAIGYAENGFPVMEKTAEDWDAEVEKLKRNPPLRLITSSMDGRRARARSFVSLISRARCARSQTVDATRFTKVRSRRRSSITAQRRRLHHVGRSRRH